jgi:hypothetical protein
VNSRTREAPSLEKNVSASPSIRASTPNNSASPASLRLHRPQRQTPQNQTKAGPGRCPTLHLRGTLSVRFSPSRLLRDAPIIHLKNKGTGCIPFPQPRAERLLCYGLTVHREVTVTSLGFWGRSKQPTGFFFSTLRTLCPQRSIATPFSSMASELFLMPRRVGVGGYFSLHARPKLHFSPARPTMQWWLKPLCLPGSRAEASFHLRFSSYQSCV